MRAGIFGETACFFDFRRREQAGFENDFDDRAVLRSGVDHFADVVADIVISAVLECADVEHHVNLSRTVLAGLFGLEGFGCCGASAEWEADDGSDFDIGAFEVVRTASDISGVDADRIEIIGLGLVAELIDLCGGRLRLEQRMVKIFIQWFR